MVQLGFGLWLDHVAPLFRFTSFLRAILVRLQQLASQPETLVLGSSRLEGAFVEIEAARIGQVGLFNAAVPAGDPTGTGSRPQPANRLGNTATWRRVWLEVSPELFAENQFLCGLEWASASSPDGPPLRASRSNCLYQSAWPGSGVNGSVPVYQYRDLIWQEFARNANRRADNPSSSQPTKASGACQRPGKGEQGVSTPRLHRPRKNRGVETPCSLNPSTSGPSLTRGGRYAARAWLRDYRVDPLNVHALHRCVGSLS
jgi:hypothetical protein